MPVTLYQRDGTAIDVDEAEAPSLIESGQLGYVPGTVVPVRYGDGELRQTRIEDLGQAAQAGGRVETAAEAAARREAIEFGGAEQVAKTAAENALSTATFGGFDAVASELGGDEYRAERAARGRVNPTAKTVGQVTGYIAPLLIPGGAAGAAARAAKGGVGALEAAGAVGRVVGAPVRAATALAETAARGVEGVAARAGLEGTSVIGRSLLDATRLGTMGAIEGAAAGAGQALSDAALAPGGNYDAIASKMLAGAAHGAEFGLLAGAGLGAAQGLVTAGIGKGLGALTGKTSVGGAAEYVARSAALHSLEPGAGAMKKLSSAARERIGGNLLDMGGIVDPGLTTAARAARVDELLRIKGPAIGDMMRAVDRSGASVDARTFVTSLDTKLGKMRASDNADARMLAEKIDDQLQFIRPDLEAGAVSHERLHAFRAAFGDTVKWSQVNKSREAEVMQELYGRLERMLENSAESAAKKMGGTFVDGYRAAKGDYQALKVAETALIEKMARDEGKRFVSLTDNMAAGAGFVTGAVTGNLGLGALMAAGAAVGNKLLRTHGPSVVAVLARRVARSESRMTSAIDTFMAKAPADTGARRVATTARSQVRDRTASVLGQRDNETRAAAYARTREAVGRVAADPYPHIQDRIGNLATHAPQVATAAAGRIARGLGYLAATAPGARVNPDSLQPHLSTTPQASDVEIAKWARRKEIVDDPTAALDHLNAGTLTAEHVEALQRVDPALYDEIRTNVMRKLADSTEKLPYQKRIQLGLLLDLPTDPSLKPAAIAQTQAMYAARRTAQQINETQRRANLSKTSNAKSHASGVDQLASGGLDQ